MTKTQCHTCPAHCELDEGQIGACHARVNREGHVTAENYGRITGFALDPVEKKPFARWMGGSYLLSVGSYGCNLHCPFCQNDDISQVGADDVRWRSLSPEQLVEQALDLRNRGNIGIAYTYNEPLVGWEFVSDCAQLAHDAGLLNAVVSNGCIEPGLFAQLLPLFDAVNIDLKAFNEEFYRACGMPTGLDAIKTNIAAAAACPTCHVEVTTLFVGGMSSTDDVRAAGAWLAELDRSIPYHISQYHPAYRWDAPPAPNSTLRALIEELRGTLDTVVGGNMW